jgi:hypothetical protein
MKEKFRDMHQQMQDQMNQRQAHTENTSPQKPSEKPAGDYIDFEEVK